MTKGQLRAISLLLIVSLAGYFLITAPRLSAYDNSQKQYSVLVKYKEGERSESQIASENTVSQSRVSELEPIDVYEIKTTGAKDQEKVLNQLQNDPRVEFAEKNVFYSALTTTPNDPRYGEQYYHSRINTPLAWDLSTGSAALTIAILDTGINGLHQDLTGKVLSGYDYVSGVNIAANTDSDDHGHGTSVAGVAAAFGNNSLGVAGVDWNARVKPYKVLDSTGRGLASDVARGIIDAADQGAFVINLSLGGDASSALETAVNYAWNTKGVVVVVAAGNTSGSVQYPAAYSNTIAVSNIDGNDYRVPSSSFGPEIDLAAPGLAILSAKDSAAGNEYSTSTGTSLSSPQVAGAAALLRARHPKILNWQVRNALQDNATKVAGLAGQNFNNEFGYGRLNVANALINFYGAAASWAGQNVNPTLIAGESYNFRVSLTNSGASTWYNTTVKLATARSLDRIPSFIREDRKNNNPSGWLSPSKIRMEQYAVAPDQTATFSFWYTVPSGMAPGTYREHFQLVADGVTNFPDLGIYWDIYVQGELDRYKASWAGQSANPTSVRENESRRFEVSLKNEGIATWQRNTVNLGTDREQDRTPGWIREDRQGGNASGWLSQNRVQMQQASVAPGQTATFVFYYTAPANKPPGTYREYFRPVADGIGWMNDLGIYWDITAL